MEIPITLNKVLPHTRRPVKPMGWILGFNEFHHSLEIFSMGRMRDWLIGVHHFVAADWSSYMFHTAPDLWG